MWHVDMQVGKVHGIARVLQDYLDSKYNVESYAIYIF
jgi:hypothetical protein